MDGEADSVHTVACGWLLGLFRMQQGRNGNGVCLAAGTNSPEVAVSL